MKKIKSHIKNHKKIYIGILALAIIGAILGLGHWLCPEARFQRACKDEKVCAYATKRLTPAEKKAFVKIANYLEKNGKTRLDDGILKEVSAQEINEVNLKINAATADVARQNLLDNMAAPEQFPGDYNCMRQTLTNRLSNEEVLFLQSTQAQNIESLKNPAIRDAYIRVSSKVMQCMNNAIQERYLAEIRSLMPAPQQKAEPAKEKAPASKEKGQTSTKKDSAQKETKKSDKKK